LPSLQFVITDQIRLLSPLNSNDRSIPLMPRKFFSWSQRDEAFFCCEHSTPSTLFRVVPPPPPPPRPPPIFFIFFPDPGPFLVPDPRLFLFCTSHFSVLTVLRIRDVYLTIFWLRILTRERVKEVTQGRYEGWVGGGGWAEDMEGRSVLSVTLVYIIILDCSRQPASGSQPASRTEATAATGAIFSLSEKKELGKGGVVESSGDQVFFYFFSGSRTFFGYNKPIPDPGSRGQKGTGSRIPDPDPHHCLKVLKTEEGRDSTVPLTSWI